MARSTLDVTWLQFARGAAALAIVLCGLALASPHTGASASAQTLPAAVSDHESALAADE